MAQPKPTPAQLENFPSLRPPGYQSPTSSETAPADPMAPATDGGFPTWGPGTGTYSTPAHTYWTDPNAPGWLTDTFNGLASWTLDPLYRNNVINDQGQVNWSAAPMGVAAAALGVDLGGNPMYGLERFGQAYDKTMRVGNTLIGGTGLLLGGIASSAAAMGDTSKSTNPFLRDGSLTWQEVGELFNPFENDATAMQQLTYNVVGITRNALESVADPLLQPALGFKVSDAIQYYIDQDNRATIAANMANPEADQKFGSPWLLFDYDYNIYNDFERKSSFESNTPFRYISGVTDAALQAYAAPDALIAMGITRARNAAQLVDLASEAGRAKAAEEMIAHNRWRTTNGAEGRPTRWGFQAEEFAAMNADEIKYVPMVAASKNKALVSGVLGATRTPEEAGNAVLALAGDAAAQKLLAASNPLAGDMLLLSNETTASFAKVFDGFAPQTIVPTPGNASLKGAAPSGADTRAFLSQFTPSGTAARETIAVVPPLRPAEVKHFNAVLNEYATYFGNAWNEVKIGGSASTVVKWADRARRKAAVNAGDFKSTPITIKNPLAATSRSPEAVLFKIPNGRPVIMLRSAAQKLGTKRRAGSGLVHLTDEMEFNDELQAIADNTPTLRRKAKSGESIPLRRNGRIITMTVDEYRRSLQQEAAAIAAAGGRGANVVKLRQQFLKQVEADLFHAHLDEYGIAYDDAIGYLRDFKYARNQVAAQIAENGWLKDGDMLVAVDDILQSELGESFPMLDFGMIDLMFKAQGLPRAGKITARKSGALRPGRRQFQDLARNFDMVWRPLALMRLGYTQRNLAEGGLRIMAAYGSLANADYMTAVGHTAIGIGNTAFNAASAVRRGGSAVARTVTLKPSVKQLRREQARDYNARAVQQQKLDETVLDINVVQQQIADLERLADDAVAHQRLVEWKVGESGAWDDVQGEASGRIGEDIVFGSHVDELWLDPIHARKFDAGWLSVGSRTGEDMARFGKGPDGGQMTVAQVAKRGMRQDEDPMQVVGDNFDNAFDSPVGTFMNASERKAYEAAASEGNMDAATRLWLYDRKRAAKQFLDDGNYLAYANEDGTYSRIRDIAGLIDNIGRNPDKAAQGFLDRVVVLPKGTPVKAVRSTVYGKTLDLSTPLKQAYYDTAWRFADFRRVAFKKPGKISFFEGADPKTDPMAMLDNFADGSPVYDPATGEYLYTSYENGVRPSMQQWADSTAALHNDLFDSGLTSTDNMEQIAKDLRGLVVMMDADPELARAVFGRLSAKALDPKIVEALDASGALIKSDQLKRILQANEKFIETRSKELIDEAQQVKNYLWDMDYSDYGPVGSLEDYRALGPDEEVATFMGGARLPEGGFDGMRYDNQSNVMNAEGVGMPYASVKPPAAGSYLVGERGVGWDKGLESGRSLFNRPIAAAADDPNLPTPQLYVLEPSSPKDFFDVEQRGFLDTYDPTDIDADSAVALANKAQDELLLQVFEKAGFTQRFDPEELVNDVYSRAHGYLLRQEEKGIYDTPVDMHLVMTQLWELLAEEADLDAVRQVAPKLLDSGQEYLARKAWAQKQWVETITDRGYIGIRHTGGQRVGGEAGLHPVHIWYVAPNTMPVDEVQPAIDAAVKIQRAWNDVYDKSVDMNAMGRYDAADQYDASSLAAFTQGDNGPAGVADWIGTERIARAAKELGYGKVVVPNRHTAEGYDVIYLHDPASANGNLRTITDRALPTYIDESAVNSQSVMDLRNAVNLAPDAMGDVGKVSAGFAIRTKAAARVSAGADRFTTGERLKLIQWMEDGNRTHVIINGADGKPIYLTKSELLSYKGATQDYMTLAADDAALAERFQILSNNDTYLGLQTRLMDLGDASRRYADSVSTLDTAMKARSDVLKTLGKQSVKRRMGQPNSVGQAWQERNRTYTGNNAAARGTVIADPFDPNTAYGNLARARSSADMTVARDLMGYTNDATQGLRRTSSRVEYKPGEQLYWSALAEDVNTLFRNDMIMKRMMRGESDEDIAKWLKSNTQETNALRRDTAGNVDEAIAQRRSTLDQFLPDAELRKHIADNDVTADRLQAYLSWRDMPGLEQLDWVDQQNQWQKFTSSMMKHLGTIPENNMVRHPFYRARFMDEMTRQLDGMDDAVTLTDDVMFNLRKQAHAYALKSTRETLYTVNRLSTPAYALRFVVPFFPAWESSMRFWAKTFYDKPVTAVRYAQFWQGVEQSGWALDEDMKPVESDAGGSAIMRLPHHLFSPGGGWLMVPFAKKIPFVGDALGDAMIPKGSLNVMLPGEYPWMPGVDPIVAVPLSAIANQKPLLVDTIKQSELWGIPVGDVVATGLLPFGKQSKEKDFIDLALEASVPATLKRIITRQRGESSAEFVATSDEIYRTMLTKWDLGNREGEYPDYEEAVNQAKDLYMIRGIAAVTLPTSVMPQSPFSFYIRESKRLDEKYRMLPDGTPNPNGTRQADSEFLQLYGETFFRYTKSLSGSKASGISPTASAQAIYEENPSLAADLARIGNNGQMLAMLTNPYALGDDFSDIIYRAQVDAPIAGAPGRYLRGGPANGTILSGSAAEDASQRDLGWRAFNQLDDLISQAAIDRGLDPEKYQSDPQLLQVRQQTIVKIRKEYPAWGVDFDQQDRNGARDEVMAALTILNNDQFMAQHGDDPHIQALTEYMQARQLFVEELAQRKSDGGSDQIDAASNEDLYTAWAQLVITPLTDPRMDAAWLNMFDRYFARDSLLPVHETDLAVSYGN